MVNSGPVSRYQEIPKVAADPDRRSLATPTSSTANWMREFFTTTSLPVGHGFPQDTLDRDSACYSFHPKSTVPIKVIVLDDTMKGPDATQYARACLDLQRLEWLSAELEDCLLYTSRCV